MNMEWDIAYSLHKLNRHFVLFEVQGQMTIIMMMKQSKAKWHDS